jgi:hypothetical protein
MTHERQWWLWVKGIDLDCCFDSIFKHQLIRSRNPVAKSNVCAGSLSLDVLGYCINRSHSHARLFRGMEFWHMPSRSCICAMRGAGAEVDLDGGCFGDNIFVRVAFTCHALCI